MRLIALLVAAAFVVACSSPRPTPKRTDAVLSGQETAEKAGEAAKTAEKNDNTGIIIASSAAEDPTSQPSSAAPADPRPPSVTVTMVNGTATMSGEPIADFAAVAKEAAEADPATALIIIAPPETPYAKVVELMDQAKAAGLTRMELRQPEPEPEPEQETPGDAATP